MQRRKFPEQLEGVSDAGETVEQGLAGGDGVLGDGPLPGRHIPTVGQNQRPPRGLAATWVTVRWLVVGPDPAGNLPELVRYRWLNRK